MPQSAAPDAAARVMGRQDTMDRRILLLLLLVAPAAALAGCTTAPPAPPGGPLPAVEVRQYRGEKLGSTTDFRENSIKGPQKVDRDKYRLRVDGAVEAPATYRYEEVLSREATYTKVVTLDCVEGWSVKILWEGVLLSDLIDRSRPDTDAVTVIFHAVDGYATSLPLSYLRDRRIILAYRMNGIEMPAERGFPFQVVAEDKWGYKWCKWVSRLELSRDPDYRGYWEQRGYSSSGDRSAPSVGP
jgi:DMSO/TMAO reductase YedYZ molybdopterin-dependent catalytic subunit